MLNKLIYYGVVLPMSYLPFAIINLFAYFTFFLLYRIIPYRKKVVRKNINSSFPGLSQKEKEVIVKKFYKHLAFLLAESVKNLSITENSLKKRMRVKNPELMNKLYDEGKSVLLVSGHFFNWEFLITAQNLIFKHQAIGIGMPLSNKFWDKKINERRARFGMEVVNANTYKEVINSYENQPTATLVLGDQSPGKDENCFWTEFLNQETAFFFGAEIIANERNMAVVYASMNQLKNGHYELELKLISDQPINEKYGFITQTYISFLEDDIKKHKHAWLWSHKRWKKDVPVALSSLKTNHQNRFNRKFRSGQSSAPTNAEIRGNA